MVRTACSCINGISGVNAKRPMPIAAANPSMPTATAHAAETICLYAS
jgi:hypothetical protein